jgi:RNA polymerase sigma factor (sigma-70 family)
LAENVFELAKQGDKHSIELLVEQYCRLAYSIAYEWIRKGAIPKDEGISEANLALMNCIRGNFDPDKGDFTSYLVRAVDNQIRMYLRREKRDRMIDYVDGVIKVEDEELDVVDGLIDEDYSIEDIVESSMMVSSVLDILESDDSIKAKEVACLMLRIEGRTCDEIAEMLGMSQSYVSRLSNNAVDKVKKVLDRDGGFRC